MADMARIIQQAFAVEEELTKRGYPDDVIELVRTLHVGLFDVNEAFQNAMSLAKRAHQQTVAYRDMLHAMFDMNDQLMKIIESNHTVCENADP